MRCGDRSRTMTRTNQEPPEEWTVRKLSQPLSRRRVLFGVATVTGGGTALALTSSQRGRASVDVDQVSVPDAEFEADAIEPVVDVAVAYAWRYDAPTEVAIELLIDGDAVATEQLRTGQTEFEATTELSGRILDSDAWSAEDFTVVAGETVTRDVTIGVSFAVIDGNEVVASDTAEDVSTIEITNPVDDYARVGMVGEIRDASDE